MARSLAELARESSGLCRDGSASAMSVIDRHARRLEELAELVYARDPEAVRAEILELLPRLALTKQARELARRIGVLLTGPAEPDTQEEVVASMDRTVRESMHLPPVCAAGNPPAAGPQQLTYSPVGTCPGCGSPTGQDEKVCPKCGIKEGDPEQR